MAAQVLQQAAPAAAPTFSKPTLLDVHISNNGARCRYVIYRKKLEDIIDIQSPKVLGGLKSEQFMACNPQGKMPLLILPDGTNMPESAVGSFSITCKGGPQC
jgi:glutathione S-transferase